MRKTFSVLLAPIKVFLFLVLGICSPAWGGELDLAWDAENGAAGYTVYYGTSSGNYAFEVAAGTNTTVDVTCLQAGVTYYFAITASDPLGNQSRLSSEISYVIPGTLHLSAGVNAGDPMNISFPVASTHWYELQSSTDLSLWITIWQTTVATSNGWVQFAVPQDPQIPQQFFRLCLH